MPRFSFFGFQDRGSSSVVCCTTITSGYGGTLDTAISKWNGFNAEAKNTFKLNRQTDQWELYEPTGN